jgi:hypothetical protein
MPIGFLVAELKKIRFLFNFSFHSGGYDWAFQADFFSSTNVISASESCSTRL